MMDKPKNGDALDWLEQELADVLDEDYELELEDATLSREIAKIYRSSHPDALDRRVYLRERVRLQSALIDSGMVGFRCAGAHHYMDVAWKRAFATGQHIGPRLFASGHFLTTTGGHFLTSGHALEVDGPYGWVKAIR